VLGLLFLLIAFIPLTYIRYRRGKEKAALFAAAAPSNERGALLRELRLRMIMSDFFFMLFLSFLVIALAGPKWGFRTVNDFRRGVDVILAFDLSRSMDVEDCQPKRDSGSGSISRLERGREIAWDLVLSQGDIRMGAVIGKGKGILAVPLTYDSETVLSFIYVLDSRSITGSGTDLESLVNTALGAFQDSIPSRREIILFSDGETLTGSFHAAVENARKLGIVLNTVGLGSDQGAMVPLAASYETDSEESGSFLIGDDGNAVISSRQSELLKSGAERTGGIYVDGNRNDAAVFLSGYINSIFSKYRLQGQRREENPRWRLFVFAAIFCLGGTRIMGFSRRRSLQKALPVLLCLVLFSSCAKTQGKLLIMEANFLNTRGYYNQAISSYLRALNYEEAVPYAEFGLGSAYFALEEEDAALGRFTDAESALECRFEDHPELRYRIHYNRGVIHFEKGDYSEAALAFREALKVDGSRIEAKRNLELSLITSARSSPSVISPPEGTDNSREMDETSVIFEYLKTKEQEQWRSREWTGVSDPSGLDY